MFQLIREKVVPETDTLLYVNPSTSVMALGDLEHFVIQKISIALSVGIACTVDDHLVGYIRHAGVNPSPQYLQEIYLPA